MNKTFDHSPYNITTTTTTATLSKIRGFTINLLYLLREKELTTSDLVELTGKYSRYIIRYLHNARKYGLVEKNGDFWKLTPLGSDFLSHKHNMLLYNRQIRKKYERIMKEERKKYERSMKVEDQRRVVQTSFEIWLKNYHRSLHDAEKVVVEVLLDHYEKTGSKFIYCEPNVYAIAEAFNIRPDQVNQVLMNLKQDHIVYHMHDRAHNAVKIGLYKDFVKMLEFSKTMNS